MAGLRLRNQVASVLNKNSDIDQRRKALRNFKRLMLYLVVAATLMVAAALLYLASTGALTPTLIVTVVAGVFVSIMLGGGLMAAGFFSADSGHDDLVAGVADQNPADVKRPDA